MADEEHSGGGGGGFGGTVDIPKVGPVKKRTLLIVGGGAAAYVVWRYWQTSQAGDSGAVAGDSDGDGYADAGTIPAVAGQGGPIGDGSGQKEPPSADQFGFHGTTNSEWTQYASTQLSAASDKWPYGDVLEALGQYLANKPLTDVQQAIVGAAIAAAGQPPEGTHVIVPGGNVPITVAPTGLTATPVDTDSIDLKWNPVAGAAGYRIYRSGSTSNVGSSADGAARVDGLQANTAYSFQVAAVSSSGTVGPKSSPPVKATTKAMQLKAPTALKVESTTKSTVMLRWAPVAGASGYRIYTSESKENVGASKDTRFQLGGLKANHTYRIHVRAEDNHGATGPSSATVSAKTKK